MKTLLNSVLQIDSSENLSQERFIISYKDGDDNKKIILNISDLNEEDRQVYDDFKSLLTTKMNETI